MAAFLLTLILLFVQASGPDAVTRELEQIEQQLAAAWKNGQCDAWASFIADEWSVIHIDGSVLQRHEVLKTCRSPEATIERFTIDEVAVRVFGDAAVVTGRTVVTLRAERQITIRLRFTDVFVRRGGRWQVVASQATSLMP